MLSGNKKLLRLLVFIFTLAFSNAFLPIHILYALPGPPKIEAKSAILIESSRGQIFYEKQSSEKTHISSINKIMTALIVIEKEKLDSMVTISKDSANSEGSKLNLLAGEKYSIDNLLYATILSSANDAANALAEFSGGDISEFVTLMNDKCRNLGLKDTLFSNPTGLFDESQYTTARDISTLIRYALKNPDFNRIFSSQVKPIITDSGTKMLINQNKLLWSYDGADGGRVGYNSKDFQTVVTSATRNNQRLISIVLDSPEANSLEDSAKLLDYGFNNYKTGILVSKEQSVKTVLIENNQVDLYPSEDVFYSYPLGDNYLKDIDFMLSPNLELPIKRDKIMGIMKFTLKDATVINVNLYSGKEIYPPEKKASLYLKKVMENRDIFILLMILILIEFVLLAISLVKLIIKLFKRFTLNNN